MVYNNDNNYAAIDYIATHRYYKLMRSSVGIININSSKLRIKTDHTTSREGNHLIQVYTGPAHQNLMLVLSDIPN